MKPADGRILVIDDDDSLRELLEYTLKKAGWQVASAEDGEMGLKKALAYRPHLIILDLMMPKLNGFEVIHALQAKGMGETPIVVITGYSESANEALIRQEPNVVEFLTKPIEYAALPPLIVRLIGDRPS